jgi:hypothetical protein
VRKRRTRVVNTKWLSVDRLIIPAYYEVLFPLPRDRSALSESFEREGYKPEYPLTVRPSETVGDYFEIVCGVGRFALACERGMRRVPIVVREMTADEALRYAVEDNLFAASSSASLTLTQAIFLSRLLEGRGRAFPPRLIRELARVSESTYWRAVKSFDLAVGKAAREHTELGDLDLHRKVAEMLRRDLFPDFTRLWTGTLEVHTFHQEHAEISTGRRRATTGSSNSQAQKAKHTRQAQGAGRVKPTAGEQVRPPGAAQVDNTTTPASGRRARARRTHADDNLTLSEP